MPRKSLGVMTGSMFYTIMAFQSGPRCGIDVAAFIETLTKGRIQLGPGTLYTILSKFLEVGYLREVSVEGRKRTYELTVEGRLAYENEIARLHQCLYDAQASTVFAMQGGAPNETTQPNMALSPLPAI